MSKVNITLVGGIALVLLATAIVLTRSPPRVLHTSGPPAQYSLGVTQSELTICQGNEVVPAGASALRFSIVAFLGSNMRAAVYQRERLLTTGSRNPNWSGSSVTVPVTPLNRSVSNARVCVAFAPNSELLQVFGYRTGPQSGAVYFKGNQLTQSGPNTAGRLLSGRVQITYLGPGDESWWSRAGAVITNMGFGHFVGGSSVAILAALLFVAMAALTVRLALREQP